ncbi:PREDICTED: DNA damage-binding protein 2 isoform X2 [Dipodomys ordii]|uniref:Damage-specific DNA-binding protein 2 n=1 Tax=Dipodomys ordii TaxID=10020 RepID=A0A1S3G9J5_DIPOR|nr:PREDICTED: DNA damage-binding protein 2 isoform X2 [Dipodomys ordii]
MATKIRPETKKSSEVVCLGSRSLRELEPEAKKLRVKGPGCSRRCESDCLWEGLASLQVPPSCSSLQVPPSCSSIVKDLYQHRLDEAAWPSLRQGLQKSFLHSLASYRIFQKAAPFDRRVTSLAWHPTHPSTLAVGSKGGDIMLWNFGIKDKPTFIKGATWHPRYNLIVVGRYPDPNFKSCAPYELRTIDIFDGNSGKMMCQLYDPQSSGIISLNEFNPLGDTLASAMGYHILIWNQKEVGPWKERERH